MSSPTWTPASLSPELRHYREWVWRLVDAQYHVSLRKLTDSLAEQALLEGLIEGTKPAVPVECRGLDPQLSAPFRYALYENGSRFRRAAIRQASIMRRRMRASRPRKRRSTGSCSMPSRRTRLGRST